MVRVGDDVGHLDTLLHHRIDKPDVDRLGIAVPGFDAGARARRSSSVKLSPQQAHELVQPNRTLPVAITIRREPNRVFKLPELKNGH